MAYITPNSIGVGVAVFVWRDGKFVLLRRIGAHGSGTWAVPGGKLKYGESWENCAKREAREEIGVEISTPLLLTVTNDIFTTEGKHFITIWVEAGLVSGEPTINEPDKLAAIAWHNFANLPSPLFEPCWTNLRQAKPELFGPV